MATIKLLDPVTRIEGHLTVEVTLDTVVGQQQVVDAKTSGTMFRGFELLLRDRPPGDAPYLTQRICGVCPVSHGLAAVRALESLGAPSVPSNARLMRNLVLGSNYLASHILHFYQLSLLDYVAGPERPPFAPRWDVDLRITGPAAQTLWNHYLLALGMRRKAHEMGALFGGRLPHPPTYVAGGFTTTPRPERIASFGALLAELRAFVEGTWLPDVTVVGAAYADYYGLGAGPRNLLSFGAFDLDSTGTSQLLARGRIEAGAPAVLPVDLAAITEAVQWSWFEDTPSPVTPAAADTVPQYPKPDAYSWLKAPRYQGQAYEVGPLARLWVSGDYANGISVMDRHQARALEALAIANAMSGWLAALDPSGPVHVPYAPPAAGQSSGVTEAPRGALGHWLGVSGGKIARYQIITPTCWNASPRDDSGVLGPLEQALVGTPVADAERPIELLRIIHSIDPCLACAVHAVRPKAGRRARLVAPAARG